MPRRRKTPCETLTTGQIVQWKPAPLGWAQVVEIRRTCVRLFYATKSGRERQPIVHAGELLATQAHPPLPFANPYGRAAMGRKSKTFAAAGIASSISKSRGSKT